MVCILEPPFTKRGKSMLARQAIEEIIENEVKGLCGTCAHAKTCLYYKTSARQIIQCEMFDLDTEFMIDPPAGLCRTCDHAATCRLPGRFQGVWHCNEFL